MEENKKEEKKKLNIKERWKDKRERAKIELMLYGIFFLAIIVFARISSSFSDSNIPKDNDIKSFINDITDNYQYDIDITIDNNNYKYYNLQIYLTLLVKAKSQLLRIGSYLFFLLS